MKCKLVFLMLLIPLTFWGVNMKIDAMTQWKPGVAIMFNEGQVILYDMEKDIAMEGFPAPIVSVLPGLPTQKVDAALNIKNKVIILSGNQLFKINPNSGIIDYGYPRAISDELPGVWGSGIDAAVNWGNGKVYFFKGNEYIRFDIETNSVDRGYPKRITNRTWPGLWDEKIDAVINWGNGKSYFSKGNLYIRYDLETDKMDDGYPATLDTKNWPGLVWKDMTDLEVDVDISMDNIDIFGDVVHLSDDDFYDAVKGKLVFVDFYADWCGPCRVFAPVFEEVAGMVTSHMFVKIDVDRAPNLSYDFAIEFIPHISAVLDGEEIVTYEGARTADDFKDWCLELIEDYD